MVKAREASRHLDFVTSWRAVGKNGWRGNPPSGAMPCVVSVTTQRASPSASPLAEDRLTVVEVVRNEGFSLDLRVWANLDESFKLTWMAGADLAETFWDEEEARWVKDRT